MHFTKFITTSALLVATGVAAIASPAPAHNDFAPLQVGRRLSRKAIQRRHWHHHHHNSSSDAGTPTDASIESAAPEPTTTDSTGDDGDCGGDEPAVVTVYTTITTNPGQDQPTDSPTETAPAPTDSATPSGGNGPSSPGATIVATGSQCGDPNAVPSPAATSGPNGDENWINCGVDGAGWVPPPITFDNLIYRDLAEVLNEGSSPFDACSQYLSIFESASADTGIPTIFLASIALQESGCNPTVTGGAGEIGMMQITSEKCPTDGSDCYDAATNIRIGASYFQTVLNDQCNGNVACTMGAYNGWQPGLTVQSANNYAICAQHNNLDYLQNVFNGYLQGVDPSSLNMGIYHNTC
jgi:hypothetical protein